MITVLQEAAKIAAAASDRHSGVELKLTEAGVAVFSHVSTERGNTSVVELVFWRDIDADQAALIRKVSLMADVVKSFSDEVRVERTSQVTEKPPVRLLQPEEWPLAVVSALAILIAIPIGGGWF